MLVVFGASWQVELPTLKLPTERNASWPHAASKIDYSYWDLANLEPSASSQAQVSCQECLADSLVTTRFLIGAGFALLGSDYCPRSQKTLMPLETGSSFNKVSRSSQCVPRYSSSTHATASTISMPSLDVLRMEAPDTRSHPIAAFCPFSAHSISKLTKRREQLAAKKI